MIKCYMFDLDGTLLNTLESIRYNVNYTLQKYGIEPISSDECRRFVGNGAKKLMERTLDLRGVFDSSRRTEIYESFFKRYNENPDYLAKPYEGIPALIDELLASGATLAVVSNKPQRAAEVSVEKFFPASFASVCGGAEGLPLKPDPTVALNLLSRLGISPSECAYIGDSEVDMQTGKNMGAALTVGVSWGFRDVDVLVASGADVIVDTPKMIKEEASRL